MLPMTQPRRPHPIDKYLRLSVLPIHLSQSRIIHSSTRRRMPGSQTRCQLSILSRLFIYTSAVYLSYLSRHGCFLSMPAFALHITGLCISRTSGSLFLIVRGELNIDEPSFHWNDGLGTCVSCVCVCVCVCVACVCVSYTHVFMTVCKRKRNSFLYACMYACVCMLCMRVKQKVPYNCSVETKNKV